MHRRLFNAILAGVGLSLGGHVARAIAKGTPVSTESFLLTTNGWVPNNQKLPVIVYRNALSTTAPDPASTFEDLFQANGWPPQWRNGVYPFHHYHTEGHEVLGIYGGSAQLMLGGPSARKVDVRAGDIVLLPAGTGHMKISADDQFGVVGAYPAEQSFDIIRKAPSQAQLQRLASLPFPSTDPVCGPDGPVPHDWHYG